MPYPNRDYKPSDAERAVVEDWIGSPLCIGARVRDDDPLLTDQNAEVIERVLVAAGLQIVHLVPPGACLLLPADADPVFAKAIDDALEGEDPAARATAAGAMSDLIQEKYNIDAPPELSAFVEDLRLERTRVELAKATCEARQKQIEALENEPRLALKRYQDLAAE
jgi:hypothetical protein